MHLEGLNYQQMAEKFLGDTASPKQLNKKVNAIKKQFTRKNTGSLARFRYYLEICMQKNHLAYADVLN